MRMVPAHTFRTMVRTAFFAAAIVAGSESAFAQVATAAADFVHQLGTENAIVTNRLTLANSHTQSGVAAGGQVTLDNAVLNQNSLYADDAYAFRAYGQLVLNGSDQSLNGGAEVVRNGATNAGLKDFSVNGGGQRVLTFGATANSTPQLTFNGNSGPPAPANFLGSADTYFSSRTSVLANASATLAAASAINPVKANSTLTFNAAAGGITVFNWDVSLQGSISQIAINAPANTTAIINVFNLPGGTVWNPGSVNFIGDAASLGSASRVLWNLEGGIDLVTTNEWWGSILGVGSTITANGNLNGQIFAEDLILNSRELHYAALAPVAIPEPSSFAALAGLAAGAWGLWRRRRLGHAASAGQG